VATISTVALYLAVAVVLLVPALRRRVAGLFVTPLPSTHAYSGALDSYRGLAAVMVAFAHIVFFCYPVFWASKDCYPYLISYGGNKAVPVFVMLSGFLIYRSVRKVETVADLKDYACRRFLRIYPLYFATTLAVFAVGQMTLKPRTLIPELFMFRTVGFPTFGNPPTWSLYVEVCFYVFLPVFVLTAGRRTGWASAIAFAALTAADSAGARETWLWKYFFLGILVSNLSDVLAMLRRWPAVREVVGAAVFAAGVGVLYYDLGGKDADWFSKVAHVPHNLAEYTLGLGFGFGLVVAGSMTSVVIARVVGIYPLRFLGTISYSIFLVHPFYILANFPLLKFSEVGRTQPFFEVIGVAPWWFGFFVFAPGLLIWSSATYLLIERPFLMMRSRPAVKPESPAVVVVPIDGPGALRRAA